MLRGSRRPTSATAPATSARSTRRSATSTSSASRATDGCWIGGDDRQLATSQPANRGERRPDGHVDRREPQDDAGGRRQLLDRDAERGLRRHVRHREPGRLLHRDRVLRRSRLLDQQPRPGPPTDEAAGRRQRLHAGRDDGGRPRQSRPAVERVRRAVRQLDRAVHRGRLSELPLVQRRATRRAIRFPNFGAYDVDFAGGTIAQRRERRIHPELAATGATSTGTARTARSPRRTGARSPWRRATQGAVGGHRRQAGGHRRCELDPGSTRAGRPRPPPPGAARTAPAGGEGPVRGSRVSFTGKGNTPRREDRRQRACASVRAGRSSRPSADAPALGLHAAR